MKHNKCLFYLELNLNNAQVEDTRLQHPLRTPSEADVIRENPKMTDVFAVSYK